MRRTLPGGLVSISNGERTIVIDLGPPSHGEPTIVGNDSNGIPIHLWHNVPNTKTK